MRTRRGVLRVGTSGFAYPAWSPAFYPRGTPSAGFLAFYSGRLEACELNGTFYRQPTPGQIAGWLSATPDDFRFSVKAHRAGSRRALADPTVLTWLLGPLQGFGDRLAGVLYRVPEDVSRDDDRLRALLSAWPAELPLTVEFRNPSWLVDEVFELLEAANAVVCATELDGDPEPPRLRVSGPFLYLRLRREEYDGPALDEWAARIEPFLDDGRDVYVFFRHDRSGQAPWRAQELRRRLGGVDAP